MSFTSMSYCLHNTGCLSFEVWVNIVQVLLWFFLCCSHFGTNRTATGQIQDSWGIPLPPTYISCYQWRKRRQNMFLLLENNPQFSSWYLAQKTQYVFSQMSCGTGVQKMNKIKENTLIHRTATVLNSHRKKKVKISGSSQKNLQSTHFS